MSTKLNLHEGYESKIRRGFAQTTRMTPAVTKQTHKQCALTVEVRAHFLQMQNNCCAVSRPVAASRRYGTPGQLRDAMTRNTNDTQDCGTK